MYERSYIWTAEKDMNLWLIIAVIYLFIYLFIDLVQFMAYKKQRPKDELQTSQRPHIKADHLRY